VVLGQFPPRVVSVNLKDLAGVGRAVVAEDLDVEAVRDGQVADLLEGALAALALGEAAVDVEESTLTGDEDRAGGGLDVGDLDGALAQEGVDGQVTVEFFDAGDDGGGLVRGVAAQLRGRGVGALAEDLGPALEAAALAAAHFQVCALAQHHNVGLHEAGVKQGAVGQALAFLLHDRTDHAEGDFFEGLGLAEDAGRPWAGS